MGGGSNEFSSFAITYHIGTVQTFPSCLIPVIFTIWTDSNDYPYGLYTAMVAPLDDQLNSLPGESGLGSRVVVVAGPAKGTLVRLSDDQLSVGRDSANNLCLRDRAVSRRHFTISKTDSAFQLIDLESHNGTFVNGIPVRRKLLTHGDTIRVGRCELVFLITDDAEERTQAVEFQDSDSAELMTTTNIRAYPSVSRPAVDVGRMARDLNALFKITNVLNSIRSSEELQQ